MAHKMILVSPCKTKVLAVKEVPLKNAGVAQPEERLIRNQEAAGSRPAVSSIFNDWDSSFERLGKLRD